jgi:hypothetical protein
VESGFPSENAIDAKMEHFQEKPALAKAGVESGFPPENATTQN